jgi:uncharacterized protein involved in copper resistance
MTIEGIIRMAKQAGFADEEIDNCQQIFIHFAKLVAKHERKECEKIIWNADAWIGSDAKIWIVKSIQEAGGQT